MGEEAGMNEDDLKDLRVFKSAKVIELIMTKRGISCAEASKLWYNSETKKETLDSKEWYLSVARLYHEFELEMNNDTRWLLQSYE